MTETKTIVSIQNNIIKLLLSGQVDPECIYQHKVHITRSYYKYTAVTINVSKKKKNNRIVQIRRY